jgi:hypothetical protein
MLVLLLVLLSRRAHSVREHVPVAAKKFVLKAMKNVMKAMVAATAVRCTTMKITLASNVRIHRSPLPCLL